MQAIKHIEIADPCHENWQHMTEAAEGRHCNNCNKIVTDFTSMTNEQIINIIANTNNLCGKLEVWQLNNINQQLKQQQNSWFSWQRFGLAACLLFIFSATKVSAQQTKVKAKYGKHLPVKNKRIKPDSLVAYHMNGELPRIPITNLETRPVVNTAKIACSISTVLGGISVVRRVSEPPAFFKEGYYQSIYDLLQNVMKL
jgi:hypothetical protein